MGELQNQKVNLRRVSIQENATPKKVKILFEPRTEKINRQTPEMIIKKKGTQGAKKLFNEDVRMSFESGRQNYSGKLSEIKRK